MFDISVHVFKVVDSGTFSFSLYSSVYDISHDVTLLVSYGCPKYHLFHE